MWIMLSNFRDGRKYNGFLAAKSLDKRQMQIRKLTEETRKSRSNIDQKVCG